MRIVPYGVKLQFDHLGLGII